jgi:hypothetical protein
MNRNKQHTITIQVSEKFKVLLVKRAEANHQSITSYIEWLVLQDAAKAEPKKMWGTPHGLITTTEDSPTQENHQ